MKKCISFLCVLIVAACATSNSALISPSAGFVPLAPGAQLYLFADATRVQPLLGFLPLEGLNPDDAGELLDRTTTVAAAFYPPGDPRRFMLAANGDYPNVRVGLGFFFSPSWKKRKSDTGGSYWYSQENNVSVSLDSTKAFVSDGDPFAPSPGVPIPEDFDAFQKGSVLAFWMDEAGPLLNSSLQAMNIPLQLPVGQVLLSLWESNAEYTAIIRLETPSVSQAKGLAAALSLARNFMPTTGAMGFLFANPPEQAGVYLTLRVQSLDLQDVALLFNMFSLYSNKNQESTG
jgi:hypothetical protein